MYVHMSGLRKILKLKHYKKSWQLAVGIILKLVFQVTSTCNDTFLFLVNIPVAQGDQLHQVVHEVPEEKTEEKSQLNYRLTRKSQAK